jgi:Na+/glutamate symporter
VFGGVVAGGLIGAMITRLIIWTNNRPKKAEVKNNNEIVSKKTNKQVTSGKTHV